MRIQYFAYLRDSANKSEENYSGTATTMRTLLNELCQRYGDEFRKWILTPEGELSEMAIILVNGNDIRHSGRLDTQLSSDDLVCVFPPVAGG